MRNSNQTTHVVGKLGLICIHTNQWGILDQTLEAIYPKLFTIGELYDEATYQTAMLVRIRPDHREIWHNILLLGLNAIVVVLLKELVPVIKSPCLFRSSTVFYIRLDGKSTSGKLPSSTNIPTASFYQQTLFQQQQQHPEKCCHNRPETAAAALQLRRKHGKNLLQWPSETTLASLYYVVQFY
jgi:hypothetical protein